MELSVVEEENRRGLDLIVANNPASSSSSDSMVKLDGLYVGIGGAFLPDASGKIDHFSIRDYVADMRRRDKRACAPFETESAKLLEEQLFPLEVPKHRYWRCNPCPEGICTPCPTKELVAVSEPCSNGGVSDGTCSNMTLVKDAGATPCDELLNDTTMETINLATGCTKRDNSCASRSNISIKATTDTKNTAFSGDGGGPQNAVHHHGEVTVPVRFSRNELVGRPRQLTAGPDTHNSWYPTSCSRKKRNTAELETGEMFPSNIITLEAANEHMPVDGADGAARLEDEDDSSTDSDEFIRSLDSRRKMKKVRLLTDLLDRKGSSRRSDTNVEDNPSVSADDTAYGKAGVVVAGAARAPPEDVDRFKQRLPSKRRVPNSNNSEVRGLANVSKKVRSTRVNVERTNLTREAFLSTQLNDGLEGSSHADSAPIHTSIAASTACGRTDTDKGKRPVIENGNTSLAHSNRSTLGDVLALKKQTESMQSLSSRNHSQLENDSSIRVGLDLSLGRALSSEGIAEDNIFRANAAFTQQKDKPIRYPYCKGKQVAGVSGMSNNLTPSHSVRKGLQWDLNERIVHDTPLSIDKQKSSSPSAYRDSTVQGMMMDISGPSMEGKNVEVQGHSRAAKKHSSQRTGKAVEQGTLDDIPMDVVEMLALNQYERRIQMERGSSAGRHSLPNRTDTMIRGSGEVRGNGQRTWLQNEIPGMTKNPHAGLTNGIVMQVDNRLPSERNGSTAQYYRWSCLDGQRNHFNVYPEHQQTLSTSIQFTSPSASIHRPRPSEVAKPAWLHQNQNMPLAIETPKRYPSILLNNIQTQARAETQHKGITISDIRGEDWKMQNKKLEGAYRPGIGEHNPKPRPSFNQYSNESIPAMQLLSLMENGMSSDPDFTADANRLVAKPFPSSGYQALSLNERNSCSPLYPYQHERPVVYGAGQSLGAGSSSLNSQAAFSSQQQGDTRNWSSNIQHQVGASGNLLMPELPGSRMERQSWERQKGIVAPPDRPGSGNRQGWDKGKGLVGASFHGKIPHPGPGKDGRNLDKEKGVASTSNPARNQLQRGRLESSVAIVDVEAYDAVSETAMPRRRSAEEGHCVLNRNPAEFSSPEPGNKYTLSGGDIQLPRGPSRRAQEVKVRRRRQRGTLTKGRDNERRRAS